jgi:hypothetical protein
MLAISAPQCTVESPEVRHRQFGESGLFFILWKLLERLTGVQFGTRGERSLFLVHLGLVNQPNRK